jgi:recombination protein RecT
MSKELATKKDDLRSLLASDRVKEQIELALPKHMTSDRMVRVALTALNKTPKLLDCKPASVLTALMTCSACGIEPDGRNAHLIPYGDTCQLILDYKGLVTLAKRNGVKGIRAERVCTNDVFSFSVVDGVPKLHHEINFRTARGDAYAYYATAITDGELDVEVMTMDEVVAIKKRSRASSSGPWITDFNEMAKKTVLRRMSKRWDITPELRDVLDADADSVREERDITPEPDRPKLFKAQKPEPVESEVPTQELEEASEIPPNVQPIVIPPAGSVRPKLGELYDKMQETGIEWPSIVAWLKKADLFKKSYVEPSNLSESVCENVCSHLGEMEP